MSRWERFNPNPKGMNVGDCAVRAMCKAEDLSWEDAYTWLCSYGYNMGDLPSSNRVWGAFLKDKRYKRYVVDTDTTVERFCETHEDGIYILALQGHVVCVKDGKYYDTWDSGNELPVYYWRKDVASGTME